VRARVVGDADASLARAADCLGVARELPRQAAALLERFIALTGEEQLLAYAALTEYLQAGETRLVVDPELQERADALRLMRAAAEHLGLPDAGQLLVRQFDAAPEEVREDWKSGRVIRAWGTWRLARQALTGGRATQTARQRALRSAYGVTKLRADDYLAGVRAWLATDPPKVTSDAYYDWARERNRNLPEGAMPYPAPLAIRHGLSLVWSATVEVARGDISLDEAKRHEFRHTRSVSTGEHDLVRKADIALIAGKHPSVARQMTYNPDFPTPVIVIGKRRYWLREDIDAYLAEQKVPERTENEFGHLYVNTREAAAIIGVRMEGFHHLRNLPDPVFRGHADRLWRRSDIEAFKKERERFGVRRGRRGFPEDQ
jgi:predicted DNA-binding transcriptional regulator AlpA